MIPTPPRAGVLPEASEEKDRTESSSEGTGRDAGGVLGFGAEGCRRASRRARRPTDAGGGVDIGGSRRTGAELVTKEQSGLQGGGQTYRSREAKGKDKYVAEREQTAFGLICRQKLENFEF